jgi:Arc/MetJ-type ribon-helix-helix transcriptional regulator
MPTNISIPLTDELRAFVNAQAGDGTPFNTPSEYIRDLIRRDRARKDINDPKNWPQRTPEEIREGFIRAYDDLANGRFHTFTGVKDAISQSRARSDAARD